MEKKSATHILAHSIVRSSELGSPVVHAATLEMLDSAKHVVQMVRSASTICSAHTSSHTPCRLFAFSPQAGPHSGLELDPHLVLVFVHGGIRAQKGTWRGVQPVNVKTTAMQRTLYSDTAIGCAVWGRAAPARRL